MYGTIIMILGVLLAVLWFIFVVKNFMVKVEIVDNRLVLTILYLLAVIGVYCAFIIVTNGNEISSLESIKVRNIDQAKRLEYLFGKIWIVLVIGYVTFGIQLVLSNTMKKKKQKEIEKNSSTNAKWNIK